MNIFKIVIYTFITMIFCIHSAFAETEVDPQILSKVNHYYEINLAKGKGCNWFQVLEAFGHGRLDNPLGCSRTPYTSKEASSKPWSGWKPIADELKRLEDLRAEEEEAQDTWEGFVSNDADRQSSDTSAASAPKTKEQIAIENDIYAPEWWQRNHPRIHIAGCAYTGGNKPVQLPTSSGEVSEDATASDSGVSCTIESDKNFSGSIRLHILEMGASRISVSSGTKEINLNVSGGGKHYHIYNFNWNNDNEYIGTSGIKVELLPGDGYLVDTSKPYRYDFAIVDDDTERGIVKIIYNADPNAPRKESELPFTVHRPNNVDHSNDLTIEVKTKGYAEKKFSFTVNHNQNSAISYDASKSTRHKYGFSEVDDGDQIDGSLYVEFKITNGYYTLDENSKEFNIQVVDTTPTCFQFTENTLGNTLEENSFVKIGNWAICDGTDDEFKSNDDLEMAVEWGLEGCSVTASLTGNANLDGPFECFLDMPKFKRDPNNIKRFTRTGRIGNGFEVHMQGGTDADTDDEEITFDPKFIILNSGGKTEIRGAPTKLIAYDDDIPERPVTSRPVYLEFSLEEYIVVEENGPAQPVIYMYYLDDNGVRQPPPGKPWEKYAIRNKIGFDVKIEEITATSKAGAKARGEEHWDYIVDNPDGIINIVVPGGLKVPRASFSITQQYDALQEGTESFRMSIVEESLPKGFYLRKGDNTSAIFIISDNDGPGGSRLDECPTENAIDECAETRIELEAASEVKEGLPLRVSLTSNQNIDSKEYTFEISNYKGSRLNIAKGKDSIIKTNTTALKAGMPKIVELPINSDITLSPGYDEDGIIRVKLKDDDSYRSNEVLINLIDQTVLQSGTENSKPLVKVETTGSRMYWTNRNKDYSREGQTGEKNNKVILNNDPDNKFIVGTEVKLTEKQLYTTEIEITTNPPDETNANKQTGPGDYKLILDPAQPNMSLKKSANGLYHLTVIGLEDNTQTYDCNGETLLQSSQACIRYKDTRDNKLVNPGVIFVNVKANKINSGIDYKVDVANHSIKNQKIRTNSVISTCSPTDNPKPQDGSSVYCMKMVQLSGTEKIKEPEHKGDQYFDRINNHNDVPFDIIIRDPHADGIPSTRFQICLDPTSTAEYYYDFRILYEQESNSNWNHGGFAFHEGCTRIEGGPGVYKAQTRFYLRVHGDGHNEGEESIKLFLQSPSNSNVKVDSTEILEWTITNDGPMPEEYLARSGHAKAAHIVDIVKGRVSQPAEREPSVKIVPGGSPGDTDPDVILEGAIIEATTRGGITIYTDLSRLNFSGDVGLKGDIKTITIGADKRWENYLLGVGFTTFKSHGEYSGGKLSEKSWAAYPYGAYYTHRLTIYGLLAFGEGSMILNPNTHRDLTPEEIGADTTWRSYALGLEYRLFENERISSSLFIDHFDQTNKSKTVKGSMEDTEVSTYRTRAGLDTTLTFSDSFSSTFTTSFNKDSFEDVHLSFGTSLNYQMNPKTNISAKWNKDGDFSSYGIGLGYTIAPGITSNVDINDSGDAKVGVQGNLSF